MRLLQLSIGLVLAGALLAFLSVPYAGVLVVFGVVAFLWWIFTDAPGRFDGSR